MYLKKLVLYGFKSFAGRTEIDFNEGITGIVGPNGSGKSNIGDAVRWVLGEQSAKALRGASMSDVIFNGTQKRKPLSYCEVSLVFGNEDGALPVAFTEVMVTRRVYRSGQSDYYINGAACRLKDVVDLFRDTGIGREGYSIVGQGRIDEILSRKSEDRRQVFEEAAGIVKFRVRKEEADRKLQRTLENAARVDDILEELSRQLAPLEEQSRTARRYMALFDEMKRLDLNLYLVRARRMEEKLRELADTLASLQQVLSDAEAALAEKGLERDRAQEAVDAMDEEIRLARETLLQEAETLHRHQAELTAVESRVANRAENRQRLRAEEEQAREKLAELARLRQTGDLEAQAKREEEQQAEHALADATAREEQCRLALEAAEQELEACKEAVISAMNRASALRADEARLTALQGQMAERVESFRSSRAALAESGEALAEKLRQTEEALAAEQRQQEACALQLAGCRQALDAADAAVISRRSEAEQLSGELQDKATRWRLLSEMAREMEGYQQSVRRAIQYARDRGIPGVRGVLAQLIEVPAELETAIDMALGAAQQDIVTDTQEAARVLIDYLREGRYGRATFLPLEAMRPASLSPRERQALSMPGCIGVASELIRCPEAFRPAVANLLGRTVVADNLAHGIPIMNACGHSFRLVTLTGELMHAGGSMTGGSSQSRNVGLLGRERELKELTARLRSGKEELEKKKEALGAAQAEKDRCKTAVSQALDQLHQQEIAVARETEHTAGARQELEAQRERLAELDSAVAQLAEQQEDIARQLEALHSGQGQEAFDREEADQRTARCQAAVAKARQNRELAQGDAVQANILLMDVRHALALMDRDAAHWEQDRAEILREQARRAETLTRMEAEDGRDREEIGQRQAELDALQAAQNGREDSLRALEKDRGQQQRSLTEVLRTIEELHARRERDTEALHKAELSQSRLDTDLRTLSDRIWNTYEVTLGGAEEFRMEDFREREADRRVKELQEEIRGLGNINFKAVEQYAEVKARFDELSTQQEDLRRAEKDLRELIGRLTREMASTFTENFALMQGYFAESFTRLFGGGRAELKLTDPDDPLNCGIEINAQPPGKKLQLLSLLSGGEKALTAIAILFAMLKLKPTPFCILDEIEAALDDANIGYYADFLKEYSRSTQFIVVTHRKGTMERCNSLYGVSMEERGVSRMVSVQLQDWKE